MLDRETLNSIQTLHSLWSWICIMGWFLEAGQICPMNVAGTCFHCPCNARRRWERITWAHCYRNRKPVTAQSTKSINTFHDDNFKKLNSSLTLNIGENNNPASFLTLGFSGEGASELNLATSLWYMGSEILISFQSPLVPLFIFIHPLPSQNYMDI